MSATVDVNVLAYASNDNASEQPTAQQLMRSLLATPEPLYMFWPVIVGYLRVAMNPRIVGTASSRRALRNVEAMLASPNVRSPSENAGFWSVFEATAGAQLPANLVTDAHIAALMRQHGVRTIYTRDRDFRRFDGIEPIDPFA